VQTRKASSISFCRFKTFLWQRNFEVSMNVRLYVSVAGKDESRYWKWRFYRGNVLLLWKFYRLKFYCPRPCCNFYIISLISICSCGCIILCALGLSKEACMCVLCRDKEFFLLFCASFFFDGSVVSKREECRILTCSYHFGVFVVLEQMTNLLLSFSRTQQLLFLFLVTEWWCVFCSTQCRSRDGFINLEISTIEK
jgi:hypothetical protein